MEEVKVYRLDAGNYYGNLMIKLTRENAYWCIENWNGFYWEEIDRYIAVMMISNESLGAEELEDFEW